MYDICVKGGLVRRGRLGNWGLFYVAKRAVLVRRNREILPAGEEKNQDDELLEYGEVWCLSPSPPLMKIQRLQLIHPRRL